MARMFPTASIPKCDRLPSAVPALLLEREHRWDFTGRDESLALGVSTLHRSPVALA